MIPVASFCCIVTPYKDRRQTALDPPLGTRLQSEHLLARIPHQWLVFFHQLHDLHIILLTQLNGFGIAISDVIVPLGDDIMGIKKSLQINDNQNLVRFTPSNTFCKTLYK